MVFGSNTNNHTTSFSFFFTLATFAAQPLRCSHHPFRRTYPKGLSSDIKQRTADFTLPQDYVAPYS